MLLIICTYHSTLTSRKEKSSHTYLITDPISISSRLFELRHRVQLRLPTSAPQLTRSAPRPHFYHICAHLLLLGLVPCNFLTTCHSGSSTMLMDLRSLSCSVHSHAMRPTVGLVVHLSHQAALAFGHDGVLTIVNMPIQLRVPTHAPCIRGCVSRTGMVRIASSWAHDC